MTEAEGPTRAEAERIPRTVGRRWDLLAFLGVLLGPAMVVGTALAARQDTRQLEEALVRDAEASLAGPFPRSVHVASPQPGNLGDALAAHLPTIDAIWREVEGERQAFYDVAAGKVDEEALSADLRRAIERAEPALSGVLAGTRAVLADLPQGRESYVPVDGTTWAAVQFAAVLAAIRVRRELAEGQAGAALGTCLDALALARDAGIVGGLVGRMSGVAITGRLMPACEAALGATEVPNAPAALSRLRMIRDAQPGTADLLRTEFRSSGLFTYAPVISEAGRSRLGPRAKAILKDGERPTHLWERVLLRYTWPTLHRYQESIARAVEAPPAEREAAMRAAEARATRFMNPLMHLQPNYQRYLARAEGASRRLDALVILLAAKSFRAARGDWPADSRALLSAGLLTPAEEERCRSASFVVNGEGSLLVSVPLPQADPEKDDAEVSIRVDGA